MIRRLMKVLVAFACGSAVGLSGTFVFAQHVSITATVHNATVAAIAVDSVGNIYATGTTASKLFVTTENALNTIQTDTMRPEASSCKSAFRPER